MNKKGATQKMILSIFYVVMAIFIIVALYAYLDDYSDKTKFNKEFIAKDLGLAIDAASFSPSDIEMTYNLSKEYIIKIEGSNLKIKSKEAEISRQYNFISKIKDFSTKSNKIEWN